MKTLLREIKPGEQVLYSRFTKDDFLKYFRKRWDSNCTTMSDYFCINAGRDITHEKYCYDEYEKELLFEPLRNGWTLVGCDGDAWIFVKRDA